MPQTIKTKHWSPKSVTSSKQTKQSQSLPGNWRQADEWASNTNSSYLLAWAAGSVFFQLSEKEWGVNPMGTLPATKSNVFLNDSVLDDVSQESDSNTCLPMMSSVYHQSKPPSSEGPRSSNFKKGGKGSPWPWIGTCPHLFENTLICVTIPCSLQVQTWRQALAGRALPAGTGMHQGRFAFSLPSLTFVPVKYFISFYIVIMYDLTLNSIELPVLKKYMISNKTETEWLLYKCKYQNCWRSHC